MSITNIYFVRHAQTDYKNKDEILRPLTEKGMSDRIVITEALKDKGITRAYSSPCKRALDTISPLCGVLGLEITVIDGFRERRVGDWLPGDNFHGFTRRQWEDFDYKLPDGDSARETQNRNIAALSRVLRECAGGTAVVGSHGMAMSVVMNYFDRRFDYGEYRRILPLMPHITRFTFNGSDTGSFSGMCEILCATANERSE